jgi:hypothetical protein
MRTTKGSLSIMAFCLLQSRHIQRIPEADPSVVDDEVDPLAKRALLFQHKLIRNVLPELGEGAT